MLEFQCSVVSNVLHLHKRFSCSAQLSDVACFSHGRKSRLDELTLTVRM